MALSEPYSESANIPFDELSARLFELPPREETIALFGTCPHARRAAEYLEAGGRRVEVIADPILAPKFQMYRLWRPNAFLSDLLPIPPGETAIDLACGNGREAAGLAAAGFTVDACDHSTEALVNGQRLAQRYLRANSENDSIPIHWRQIDLEADGPPPQRYDLAVSFRYLHRPLLRGIAEILNPGGSLVVETFTVRHRARHGKPRSDAFVLEEGELPGLAEGLVAERFDEGWREDGSHTARLWARRPW